MQRVLLLVVHVAAGDGDVGDGGAC